MDENITTPSPGPGDELRFHGLRLARGPIRTYVRCRSDRFLICDYRVGGLDRHLIVDLEARTRCPVPGDLHGAPTADRWCQDLLEDLEAGLVSVSCKAEVPLDIIVAAPAP